MSDTETINSTVAELCRGIDIVLKENARMAKVVEALDEENSSLWAKQRRADDLFGTALVQAAVQRTGPSRPNRPKLTPREVKDIRQAHRGGMRQSDLAANYGVNPATISRTVRGFYN